MKENFRSTYGRWLASLYFCLAVFIAAISGPDMVMLAIALVGLVLFAPPAQRIWQPHVGFALKGWKALPVFVVFLVVLTTVSPLQPAQTTKEKAAATLADTADAKYYAANKDAVLANIAGLVRDGKYTDALALSNRYQKVSTDADLQKAGNAARKANFVHALGSDKEMPVSRKAYIYTELAKLEPGNHGYATQAAAFTKQNLKETQRLAMAQAETERRLARKAVLEKQFSGWDGSHPSVVKAVKQTMKNPASYEHVETRYAILDDGIRVKMTFRGTNSFGGIVPNTVVALLDDDGNVRSIQNVQ